MTDEGGRMGDKKWVKRESEGFINKNTTEDFDWPSMGEAQILAM